jgi:hypothetical protein
MCMFFHSYHSLNFPAMNSLAVTYIPLHPSISMQIPMTHDTPRWIVDITTLRWGTWIIWPALLWYPIICHYYTHESKLNGTPCSMMSQPDWPPREVPCDGSRSGEPQKKTAEPYRIWIGLREHLQEMFTFFPWWKPPKCRVESWRCSH